MDRSQIITVNPPFSPSIPLKAIGGVKGQKYELSLYERAFQYEVTTFYGMLKFNS